MMIKVLAGRFNPKFSRNVFPVYSVRKSHVLAGLGSLGQQNHSRPPGK